MDKKIKNKNSIFIFTRDLRLQDNTTLLYALRESETVIPIFIFNPKQIEGSNKYKSDNCVQFMCECLDELSEELKKKGSRLYFFYDEPDIIIESLLKKYKDIDAVYINMDYTPFAKKRDLDIASVCKKYDVDFYSYEDYLLTGKDKIVNSSGECYVKFTPFFRSASKLKVKSPDKSNPKNYIEKKHELIKEYKKDYNKSGFYANNPNISVHGGRKNALKILKNILDYKDYNEDRDYPNKECTTKLSAYLKFNVVSIREVYEVFKKKLGLKNKLIQQLYWREFYMIILNHYPQLLQKKSMKPAYDNIKWDNNSKFFKLWCEGKTGIPINDAGMRQMNQTGFMHNRCRMIVASVLIKSLQIDWRWGEKYFATKLVDYDPANNNGGWGWVSSSSTDSQPFFRIFNPYRQAESFDKECEYIKKWIPELKDVPAKDILNWEEAYEKYPNIKYPAPIINFAESKEKTLKMYKAIYKK
jgi:deoxyribodipyrimidine photo-lyase